MANIINPDCGWVHEAAVNLANEFVEVESTAVADADGWDVAKLTNAVVKAASGASSDITITSIENMAMGKIYHLLLVNAANSAIKVVFPDAALEKKLGVSASAETTVAGAEIASGSTEVTASTTVTLSEASLSNGDAILYTFFTDGSKVYVSHEVFA